MFGISINLITGDSGVISRASKSQLETEKGQELEELGMAVSGTFDDMLRLDLNELKENILKQRKDAIIVGDSFPLKVMLKRGTYRINESGKIERLTGISLNAEKLVMQIIDGENESKMLNATLTDIDGEITWSSNNISVVTVDNTGMLTTVGVGEAKITASCSGETAECNVTVKSVKSINSIKLKINGIEVNENEIKEVDIGGSIEITVETNSDATEDVIWESSNSRVAMIEESGGRNLTVIVKGIDVSNEEVTITARGSKGVSKSIKVKVLKPKEYSAKDITASLISDEVIVDYVEYKRTSGSTKSTDWQVLYADNNNIYLIMRYAILSPAGVAPLTNFGDAYLNGTNIISDISTNEETQRRFPAIKDGWFNGWIDSGFTSTFSNMQATLYMLDSDVWSAYKGKYGKWTIGGPTMELAVASFDKTEGTNYKSEISVPNNIGYKINDPFGVAGTLTEQMVLNNKEMYWLASPHLTKDGWGEAYVCKVSYYNGGRIQYNPIYSTCDRI